MPKSLLNVYKQQNPDATCQLSKSTLGCVPKLNNRNGDSFEQDNGSDGSVGDQLRSDTIGERINEAIWENCRRSIGDPQNKARVIDRSNNYVSTNSIKFYGKAYVDKHPSTPSAIDSKQSGITTQLICEHKIEPSVGQTNQPGGLNINSQTEISLLNVTTKEEMQSTNQHFASNMLENAQANKTAALADIRLAESKHLPSDEPDSSQTLHVVLLDVSNPNTYQKKRDMKDFSNLTAAVPNLLEQKSDSQSNGNLSVSKDLNEQLIKSRKCVKHINQHFNNNNYSSCQRIEDNRKKSFGDLNTEAEYGNRTSLNMPAVFMNSSSISRSDSAGSSNFWQPDSAVLQDDQTLEQVHINKKPRQTAKDQFNVCVPSPGHPPFKSVFPNINLQIEPVTKTTAVSVTDKEAIVGNECIECTTVESRSVASCRFTATQIGKNTAMSGNSTLRSSMVTSQVLNQVNKASFSNMSHCFLSQPDNLARGLNFPSQKNHPQLIQEHMRQMQAKPVQSYVTMAKPDQQIPCMVSRPNVFQGVCRQANQSDNLGHCNRENNVMQFRNQILLQQTHEPQKKHIFECQLPSCRYGPNTQDLNSPHVEPRNELKDPINARSPLVSDNFVKKFQMLLPNLKVSLCKAFTTSSEAVSQNIAGNHSEGNFVKDFENSLENLMGILDRAEIYLQSAKEIQMQSFLDTWFTPYYCQDQIPSKTYSDYCNVAKMQIQFVQEIHDAISFLDSFKKNNDNN